ncbi:hypothetical protein PVK06_004661 [Gossypium arboreum]|uniref:Uncharacterized protein n=1 Tax=Gossypium arboreum TaxID=29729 RepID=A0ABR0QSL7_GOSAR|nr:hypothetical protein PVK06_004661 [Gossypium arboreum]
MDSSAQIWNTLATIYGSRTTSRLMFYRRALHSQCKGDLLMKDFLMKVKGYCDSLASCAQMQSALAEIPSLANMVTHQQTASVVYSDSNPTYFRALGSSHGRGRGRMCSSCIQYQLCGKIGHLVDRCYHRFDATYKSIGYFHKQMCVCLVMDHQCHHGCLYLVYQCLLLQWFHMEIGFSYLLQLLQMHGLTCFV